MLLVLVAISNYTLGHEYFNTSYFVFGCLVLVAGGCYWWLAMGIRFVPKVGRQSRHARKLWKVG